MAIFEASHRSIAPANDGCAAYSELVENGANITRHLPIAGRGLSAAHGAVREKLIVPLGRRRRGDEVRRQADDLDFDTHLGRGLRSVEAPPASRFRMPHADTAQFVLTSDVTSPPCPAASVLLLDEAPDRDFLLR